MAESESVRTARLATGSREPFRLRVELELENKGRSESWREKSKGNRRKGASGTETGFSSYPANLSCKGVNQRVLTREFLDETHDTTRFRFSVSNSRVIDDEPRQI